MKEELHICICASKDNFGAYSENCQGIFGAGNTVEDCKKDVLKSIEEVKSYMPREEWPALLRGEYEIVWEYDVQSLLCHYGVIMSLSGLERVTGIHQKQLWAYMHGRSVPRPKQREKIETALNSFGKELSAVRVYK